MNQKRGKQGKVGTDLESRNVNDSGFFPFYFRDSFLGLIPDSSILGIKPRLVEKPFR